MKQSVREKGFSIVIVVVAVLVIAAAGAVGWFVYSKTDRKTIPNNSTSQNGGSNKQEAESTQQDETAKWVSVTTQDKAFSMKVPDGWKLTNYPKDYIGGVEIVHKSGTPAAIESSGEEYIGHSLRFRASIAELDDAGLGPQWASPQPGLNETTEDFSIGTLQGKRYKGIFSQDINQTIYEYVFDLGNNKKLDIAYTIHPNEGEKEDVATVEKAIKTIQFTGSRA